MSSSHPQDNRKLADADASPVAEASSVSGAGATTDEATVIAPPGASMDDTASTPQKRPLPVIEGYEIQGELGRGGMGVVYRARETRLKRTCALKMILAGGHADDEAIARFLAEAEVVARLQHPNVVQIHHIGAADGLPFIELEYVDGGSLDARLDGVPWPPRRAAELVQPLARGVAEAHRRGIVHRDLKPGNVLLAADGTPKITDFGLAKSLEKESGLTRSDSVLGSPAYMAPEQAEGKAREVGPLADVYALGAILYQLLTGRPPFRGATVLETLEQVKSVEPVPPSRLVPGLPRDLETIALKCLQKDMAKRYESAAVLDEDLRRFLNGEPIVARPVGLHERVWRWCRRHPAPAALTAAVVLVAALGLAGILWQWSEAVSARDLASRRARAEAEARQEVETMLVDMYTTSGLLAGDQRDHARAALWFANAARRATSDPERRSANALRARTWGRAAFAPLRAVVGEGTWPGRLTFHPAGRHLITRTIVDGSTRETRCTLWDLNAERSLEFLGEVKSARAAAWSPDGRALAVAGPERDVVISDFPGGDERTRIPFAERVRLLIYSADGRYLATAGGLLARVWDVVAGDFVTSELVHPAAVTTLAFDPHARHFATGCVDNQARLFAVVQGTSEPLWPPVAHIQQSARGYWDPQFCSPPAFGDEGRDLITYSDGALIWRATDSGKEEARLLPPELPANLAAAEPSPDGRLLAVFGAQSSTVRLVDAATGHLAGPAFEHQNTVYGSAISPDNKLLVTASSDNTARLWSVSDGRPLAGPLDLHRTVNQVAFAPGGKALATQDADIVRLWSVPGEGLPIDRVHVGSYSFAAVSRDGSLAIPTGVTIKPGLMREARVCRVATAEPAGPPLVTGGAIIDAAFSPDGRTVAIADRQDGQSTDGHDVQVWDWEGGGRRWRVEVPPEPRSVAFSPDGDRLAVLCATGELIIYDSADGREAVRWRAAEGSAPNNWINNGKVGFSPDGRSVLTWGMGQAVSVFDAETGRLLYEPLTHRDICHDLKFSPDGRSMALAWYDGSVNVCDFATGALLAELSTQPDNVFSAGFSPDGKLLVTACRDRSVRVWDWHSGRLVSPPFEHPTDAVAAAFTPDGRWVLSASAADEGVRVWDWRGGKPVAPPLRIGQAMTLFVTPDGRRAVVGGFSGTLALVHLDDLAEKDGADVDAARAAADMDALCAWAELLSGQHLHAGGGTVNLSADEWLTRWRARAARPELER